MVILFFLVILLLTGCETDSEKSVTGAFFDRNPGEFTTITAPSDSVMFQDTFRDDIGDNSYTLAGKYNTIEAASVYSFNLSSVSADSLLGAAVNFEINDIWEDGDIEFALYKTHSDWSDSSRIDRDSFELESDDLISTFTSDSSDLDYITFDLDSTFVNELFADESSDTISFLLKNTDSGASMVSILSDNTSSPPSLMLFTYGSADTTNVYCLEGTYYIETHHDNDEYILSEGDASGFIVKIGIPESVPRFSVINSCILKLNALERIIPDNPMSVDIYLLDAEYTTLSDVELNGNIDSNIEIYAEQESYEVDITSFVNAWHIAGYSNFGLLIRADADNVTPNQCVMAPGDSLTFTFTTLPEIE